MSFDRVFECVDQGSFWECIVGFRNKRVLEEIRKLDLKEEVEGLSLSD